jgi:hypothetical protein
MVICKNKTQSQTSEFASNNKSTRLGFGFTGIGLWFSFEKVKLFVFDFKNKLVWVAVITWWTTR